MPLLSELPRSRCSPPWWRSLDVVREFELVNRMGPIRAVDEALLFEAVVYSVARLVFQRDETRAFNTQLLFGSPDPDKDEELRTRVAQTFRTGIERATAEEAASSRDEVSRQLNAVDADQGVSRFANVARRAQLLC
jgi:hypothetical protein